MMVAKAVKFRTGYMDRAWEDLPGLIDEAKIHLKSVKFDTVIGSGLSGAMVVPALAIALGKKFAIVRKSGDGSHHQLEESGELVGQVGDRWIFVDDFVSSGRTRARVKSVVERQVPNSAYMGTYKYNYGHWLSSGSWDDY